MKRITVENFINIKSFTIDWINNRQYLYQIKGKKNIKFPLDKTISVNILLSMINIISRNSFVYYVFDIKAHQHIHQSLLS
jgi:hypothetical protein